MISIFVFKFALYVHDDEQIIMISLPIPVPDLCCAISGANISGQHLEGGCFSCSVHSQETKAL